MGMCGLATKTLKTGDVSHNDEIEYDISLLKSNLILGKKENKRMSRRPLISDIYKERYTKQAISRGNIEPI